MWTYGRGLFVVFLCVTELPNFVEDEAYCTRSLCDVGCVQIEDFRAEAVGSVPIQVAVSSLGQPITDVLREVLLTESVV